MSNSIQNHQIDTLSSTSKKKPIILAMLDSEEEVSSPLFEFALADTIQIIRTDGLVLCSYQTKSHLAILDIEEIRVQVIDHSRKLSLEAYQNDIIQLLIKGFYVYFRVRKGCIIYFVACSSCSYAVAQDFMSKLISIYDETILEIFGQNKLPKNISQTNLIRLQILHKKVDILVKQISNIKNTKGTNISRESQNLLKSMNESSLALHSKVQGKKSIQSKNQQILNNSTQLKVDANRLSIWISCKKYLLYAFFVVTIMIACYLFSIYY